MRIGDLKKLIKNYGDEITFVELKYLINGLK